MAKHLIYSPTCGNCSLFHSENCRNIFRADIGGIIYNGFCHLHKKGEHPFCKYDDSCCHWETKKTIEERVLLLEKAVEELQDKKWF